MARRRWDRPGRLGIALLGLTLVGCAEDPDETSSAGASSIGTLTGSTSAATGTGESGDTEATGDAGGSGDASASGGDPECPYADPDGDEDDDGIANAADLCPCEVDPNQRDFDGDGRGDACDNPLLFATAEGGAPINILRTTVEASVTQTIVGQEVVASCTFDIDMEVLSGESLVRVGDDGRADLWFARLGFADTGERTCAMAALGVTFVNLKVRLDDIVLESALPWQVGFSYSPADHAAGVLQGLTDGPQDMAITGTFVVLESDNEALSKPGNTYLRGVPGRFATAAVKVEDQGGRFTSTWADPEFVTFDQVVSESGVRVRLLGMEGVLRMIY